MKTLALVLVLAASVAHATHSTSWFTYTPRCCNAAAIRTDIQSDDYSRIIGGRFEWYRLKNDGTCQHVKHVFKMAHYLDYVHFDTRSEPEGYFENGMKECCGAPNNPWQWTYACHGYDGQNTFYFYGPDPTVGETLGIPASVP